MADRKNGTERSERDWATILGSLVLPWTVLFGAWEIGVHRMMIALGGIYIMSMLFAAGRVWGDRGRG